MKHDNRTPLTRKVRIDAERQKNVLLRDNLRDAFVLVDMKGVIVECNDAYCEMLGYSRDEIHTLTYQNITPLRWHEMEDQIVREQIIALGYSEIYEKEYQRKDGTVFPVELRTILARDEAGVPVAMWGIVRDISERKRVEQRLKADLAALTRMHELSGKLVEAAGMQAILQDIVDAAVVIAGAQHGMLHLLENGALGIVAQHGHQNAFMRFFTSADSRVSVCADAMRRGERIIVEDIEKSVRFAGTPYQRLLSRLNVRAVQATPILGRSGKLLGVLTTHWDVPYTPDEHDMWRIDLLARQAADLIEQVRSEAEIRRLNESLELRVRQRTEQLRSLVLELTQAEQRERGRLASLLHDHLQQLLVAIKLGLEVEHRKKPEERANSTNIEHVLALVNDSIHATKSLTVELSPPILHEAGLVPALNWLARWMREKHKLTVMVAAHGELAPDSQGIGVLLFQCVRELLFNIVKHAGVETATVTLDLSGKMLLIEVADAGTGFDTRMLGLPSASFGLHSIRERLRVLDGVMDVVSAPWQGTRVQLRLPRPKPTVIALPKPRAHSTRIEAPVAVAKAANKKTVLVVDDHRIVREGVVRLLQSEPDIDVVGEANDGESAIEMAHRLHPDVVVMDINMPGMNGIEATRRIHADLPGIRVIGLSMHAEADRADDMLKAGACTYLSKGGPSEDLIAAIRKSRATGHA